MSIQKLGVPGIYYATEVADAVYKTSVTSITISGGVATVTATAHGLSVGSWTSFSGVTGTGVTGLNGDCWQVLTVPTANTYTFATSLSGTPGGTIIQEPLTILAAGTWVYVLGANGLMEYNPDNKFGQSGNGSAGTWRTLTAASATGVVTTDGFAVRFRHNGTTATSYLSQVE